LDPQEALACAAAREQPVEQEGADPADVQEPGRARGHADADAHAGRVDGSGSRPTVHTDGISSMVAFRKRIEPAASHRASAVPIVVARTPASTKPSGVSTNEPSTS